MTAPTSTTSTTTRPPSYRYTTLLDSTRVDQLLAELRQLAARVGIDSEAALEQIRQEGPPAPNADATAAGRFGLAVFHKLASDAQRAQQPLILDY